MPDSETEDETIARIETALQKIASLGKPGHAPGADVDRDELVKTLDGIIGRLRGGLEPPGAEPANPAAQVKE